MTDGVVFGGARQVAPDGSPLEPTATVEELRAGAHADIVAAIERYTVMIVTSSDIPAARRGALVAQLGKLTVQAARAAPMPTMTAAALRRMGHFDEFADNAAYGELEGYPPLANPGDLGNIQRQTIAALTAPKEVDKARTLDALVTTRDTLRNDTSEGARALCKKLDEKIARLIDELAPDAPPLETPPTENGD